MSTIKTKNKALVKTIGEAYKQCIVKECCICHNVFVMGCKDYIFNTCGKKVYSNDPNKICEQPDWCCEECANEIIRIKNL